jgi:ribonuclease-3
VIKKFFKKLRLLTTDRKEPYLLLSKTLGFKPKNFNYYELALLHKSSSVKDEGGRFLNNERLEFLGDAILDAVVADILYHKFPGKREGFLTNARSKIVQRDMLNKIAADLELNRLMVIPNKNHSHNLNIYGNAFEALIGAIYLDYGYQKCKSFMENVVFEKYLDITKLAYKEVNFKSRLLEWSQKNKVNLVFDLIEETVDSENNPVFQTKIIINGISAGYGIGYSKKESQQNAAKIALQKIKSEKALYLKTENNNIGKEEQDSEKGNNEIFSEE